MDKILNSGYQAVLAVTGGGTGVFPLLLNKGGGSKFLLEGIIPYCKMSLEDLVLGTLYKTVSEEAAYEMSFNTFDKAAYTFGAENPLGVGATAKLSVENERQGRSNEIYVCITNGYKVINSHKVIENNLFREVQEDICSRYIKECIEEFIDKYPVKATK